MSFVYFLENGLLELIFKGTSMSPLAKNEDSSPLTEFWISLHTASPGDGGNQTTNEATYGGYSRVSVARTGMAWVVTSTSVSPVNNIEFPVCISGSNTITHWGIGSAQVGSGILFFFGTVTPNLSVSYNVTPIITTDSTITLD